MTSANTEPELKLLFELSQLKINQISENSLILLWPEIIDEEQHQQLTYCQHKISHHFAGIVVETVSSYNSLMVLFDLSKTDGDALINDIRALISSCSFELHNQGSRFESSVQTQSKLVEVPVYYGEDTGWDLYDVSKAIGISIDEIIELHTQTTYRAYALGFVPGFCYLAKLPEPLKLTRRSTPRLIVPKGAVAIAESQTAVYPCQSPGGWHILGQTPLAMFSATNDAFSPTIAVGDSVKFKAITKAEFLAMGGELMLEPNANTKRVSP